MKYFVYKPCLGQRTERFSWPGPVVEDLLNHVYQEPAPLLRDNCPDSIACLRCDSLPR
jgi:hypothetical protein